MTNEEFEEKYKGVHLRFSGYYKYSFSFRGIAGDGVSIYATYGGDADDIYRFEVSAEETVPVGVDIENSWSFIRASKDDREIFSYSGY